MRLKKKSDLKTNNIAARCTDDDRNRVQAKANLYTEGNIAEWVLFAALNHVPSKEDFEEEKPKTRGRKK